MDRVYIVCFTDAAIMMFPTVHPKEHFGKNPVCYSCGVDVPIDEVREFIYTHQCNLDHSYLGPKFKREW